MKAGTNHVRKQGGLGQFSYSYYERKTCGPFLTFDTPMKRSGDGKLGWVTRLAYEGGHDPVKAPKRSSWLNIVKTTYRLDAKGQRVQSGRWKGLEDLIAHLSLTPNCKPVYRDIRTEITGSGSVVDQVLAGYEILGYEPLALEGKVLPLDPLTFHQQFTAFIEGCKQNKCFEPLADWIQETFPCLALLFDRPGELAY